jgi:hypothetical protein
MKHRNLIDFLSSSLFQQKERSVNDAVSFTGRVSGRVSPASTLQTPKLVSRQRLTKQTSAKKTQSTDTSLAAPAPSLKSKTILAARNMGRLSTQGRAVMNADGTGLCGCDAAKPPGEQRYFQGKIVPVSANDITGCKGKLGAKCWQASSTARN